MGNEAHQRQLNLFLTEVQQQAKFPEIRAYMRLYSAMPIPKLSQFLELDADTLRTLLMCYKYKTRPQGSLAGPSDGMPNSTPDVSFTLDGSMMHMVAPKPEAIHEHLPSADREIPGHHPQHRGKASAFLSCAPVP